MAYMNADYGADGLGPQRLVPAPRHDLRNAAAVALFGAFIGWFIYRGTAGYSIRTPRLFWPWFLTFALGIPLLGYWAMAFAGSAPLLIFCFLLWPVVFVVGLIACRLDVGRQMFAQAAQVQQAAAQQQAWEQQQQQAAARQQAQMTGQAMVDAMKQAVRQDAQRASTAPSASSQRRRNVIDVPALPPAPQSPTGPSQRTPASPPPPMGSSTPTLWVPTFSGPAVQRRETTLGGTVVTDRRRIDPDEL
jgi:hypothetical protein